MRPLRPSAVRAAAVLAVLGLGACGGGADGPAAPRPASSTTTAGHAPAPPSAKPRPVVALRTGERFLDLSLPQAYAPKAPTATGHDDYRCFLLDPHLTARTLVKGVDIVPGDPRVVHHVIVFKVDPDEVARARAADAKDSGPGWSCFGDRGIGGGPGQRLDRAPWIGAWAPGGGERVLPGDVGIPLEAGSQVVLQVHYNLLAGPGEDRSRARLRVTADDGRTTPLETVLLVAPVELPCRTGRAGALCLRPAAVADVRERFGEQVATADLLHLLCGPVRPGPTQSCTRRAGSDLTIRAVAGHMHLLGRSVTVDVDAGQADARRVLDVPVYDFDDQGSRPLAKPVRVRAGDTLTVTCRHDQSLRDVLPAFAGQPERYVVWGEGTTDEMCLGILLVTRP